MIARLLLLAVLLAAAMHAAAQPSLVILPFDNVSGAERAPAEVGTLLVRAIEAKGWSVEESDLRPLLEEERVRYFDSIDDGVRAKIVHETGAAAILSGTIYTFAEGKNPIVALSARLVRADGTLAWGDVVGVAADDTEQWFGFGRKEAAAGVAVHAVKQLLARFPKAGEEGAPTRGLSKPMFRAGAVSFRAGDLDPRTPHLVCVLPFENEARTSDGSRVVAEILSLRLAAAEGFEVVEPAKLRAAAVKARIASFRAIGSDGLEKLAAAVGTSLFLRGTIYEYEDVTGRGTASPSVFVEMSLVDVESGRVLWAAQHDRDGADYTGLLLRGAVSNAVALTDRVVTEMIDSGKVRNENHEANRKRYARAHARAGRDGE